MRSFEVKKLFAAVIIILITFRLAVRMASAYVKGSDTMERRGEKRTYSEVLCFLGVYVMMLKCFLEGHTFEI